jgi:undecaprenyl-diphosphatase
MPPASVTGPSQDLRSDERLCLHCDPPLTPAGFFAHRRLVLLGLGVLFISMAVAGWLNGGWLLLQWDAPIQHFVEGHRTVVADEIFRRLSFLASTVTVLVLGTVMAAVAWRRCRAVGVAVLLAMLSRPLLEFTLKALVSRDRPDFQRMVDGTGHSFPSGHVMAAVALWGLLPLVLTLYTRNRRVWWGSVIGSGILIVAIGASRVYLGVHWFSDVIGGLIVGTFFLLGTEWVLKRQHRRDPCVRGCSCAHHAEAPTPTI